jgi:hypothetical protein
VVLTDNVTIGGLCQANNKLFLSCSKLLNLYIDRGNMENQCEVQSVPEKSYPQEINRDFHPLSEPLPYFPTLGKLLSGAMISLVVCYLEIHHPAPPAENEPSAGRKNLPIYLDCARAAAELGVSRRTLHINLCCLSTWYLREGERERSARAGREFLRPEHTQHGKIKLYSIVGPRNWRAPQTLAIRRNLPQFAHILASAGIKIIAVPQNPMFSPLSQTSVFAHSVHSLPEILDKACGIKQDRRVDRWERWRKVHGKERSHTVREGVKEIDEKS